MAVTVISAMENPVQAPTIKKYLCCPNDFGYLGVLDAASSITERFEPEEYKRIRLCTVETTENCDDVNYDVTLPGHFFVRLFLEAEKEETIVAQNCLEQLKEKIRKKKILYQSGMCITKKDLLHRLLPHVPARQGVSNWDGKRLWQIPTEFDRLTLEIEPCIHKVAFMSAWVTANAEFHYFTDNTLKTFWMNVNSSIPSLRALALEVVKKHRKQEALKILPQELKSLIEQ